MISLLKVLSSGTLALDEKRTEGGEGYAFVVPNTRALHERLIRIREAAGFGGRRMAAFAKILKISPAALHYLETGQSKQLGKSFAGYLGVGANPDYILYGTGEPLMRDNKQQRLLAQRLARIVATLDDADVEIIITVAERLARQRFGIPPDENDPAARRPPRSH